MDNFLGISLYFVNPSPEWVPLFSGMREGQYPVQIELVVFLSGSRKTLYDSLKKAISFYAINTKSTPGVDLNGEDDSLPL